MPWFIKTENFNEKTLELLPEERQKHLVKHNSWVINLRKQGVNIISGYLVNERKIPGGGGLLIIEALSFTDAKEIIETDPMIKAGLVNWKLNEWIAVAGELRTDFSADNLP